MECLGVTDSPFRAASPIANSPHPSAIPIDHRKRSFSSPTSFLHRLLLSVPSQPDRPHERLHAPPPPPPHAIHRLDPALLHRPLHRPHHHRLRCSGSAVCFSRYTARAQAAAPPPPAPPSRPHSPTHIPPWLIIVHLCYYHGPLWPATTYIRQPVRCAATNAPCPDMPRCHVPHWRLCTKRVRPDYCMI